MLLGAGRVYELIEDNRLCWITGRLRGGKTSLAYRLFPHFGQRGYRLVTNNRSVWADDMNDVHLLDDGKLWSYILIDERDPSLKRSSVVDEYTKMAGKMEIVVVLSSFQEPHREAQLFTIQALPAFGPIGIPVRPYVYEVRHRSVKEKGYFYWVNYSECNGIYSTQDPSGGIASLSDWVSSAVQEFRLFYGRDTDQVSPMDQAGGFIDLFLDAVSEMGSASDAIATAALSFGKGRKK